MPYLWAEEITDYQADNVMGYQEILEAKRLNFFIGRNNAGKSRFLRAFFCSKNRFNEYQPFNISQENWVEEYKKAWENIQFYDKQYYQYFNVSDNQKDFIISEEEYIKKAQHFITQNFSKLLHHEKKISEIFRRRWETSIKIHVSPDSGSRYTEININSPHHQIQYQPLKFQDYDKKFYISILRGMRPLHEDTTKHVYNLRNQKDYQIENSKYIITGEDLYDELQKRLLGEPEDRQLIEDYQKILSQYFFDNEPITLIPKIETDVVHIKIGNAKQFPIYHLGDGLQQAILLTYDAFLRKSEVHAYFIEEPELHMHAGMVRQLMNFYLNETQHYYFFTTHSNHLLDMADESEEVMIQKFSKHTDEDGQTKFQINRCDRDRDLLQSLGVKPSSVYLANCTIWVEGITDRLYLIKYMERYLQELKEQEEANPPKNAQDAKYPKYRRFMLHYHYAFVEYAGSNMVHWNFENALTQIDGLEDNGLSARAIASDMLLIADADTDKGNRIPVLTSELGEDKFCLLKVKEIENTLPKELITKVAKSRFERMNTETKEGFNINQLDQNPTINFHHHKNGIGKILDNHIRTQGTDRKKLCFAEASGTIKYKLQFCHEIITLMDEPEWTLTEAARDLAQTIFKHIEQHNS